MHYHPLDHASRALNGIKHSACALTIKYTECEKSRLMKLLSLLVSELLSQSEQNAVRCGHGTFLQTFAVVHKNGLAGCYSTF